MPATDTPLRQSLKILRQLAVNSLHLWGISVNAAVDFINVSENTTFLITSPDGNKSILRIYRENYRSRRAISSELSWIDALRREGVVKTPKYFFGCNGYPIQQATTARLPAPRFMVRFEFVAGDTIDSSGDLTQKFESLGMMAANCHQHSLNWKKPPSFERNFWDLETIFGTDPIWGDWRDAPGVHPEVKYILEQVEESIKSRLNSYGKASKRYNLIHADMRFANLLVDGNQTILIDFDDCGYGWLMYDFAAAISFIENNPRIPTYKTAWLRGYRRIRSLEIEDEMEIDTFIMFRRMALLAWIGSHLEAPEPQQLAPDFAKNTALLGQKWLQSDFD